MSEMISMLAVIAVFFGILSGLASFFITYNEQDKNNSLTGREKFKNSLRMTIYTIAVLTALVFITLYFLMGSF
jgi:uncharacterized BrkB/YihY/UPF0761 family membrane protein